MIIDKIFNPTRFEVHNVSKHEDYYHILQTCYKLGSQETCGMTSKGQEACTIDRLNNQLTGAH